MSKTEAILSVACAVLIVWVLLLTVKLTQLEQNTWNRDLQMTEFAVETRRIVERTKL